jgi:hypothetical protein
MGLMSFLSGIVVTAVIFLLHTKRNHDRRNRQQVQIPTEDSYDVNDENDDEML